MTYHENGSIEHRAAQHVDDDDNTIRRSDKIYLSCQMLIELDQVSQSECADLN